MGVEEMQKALAEGQEKVEQATVKSREDFTNLQLAVQKVLGDLPDFLGLQNGQWYDVEAKTAAGAVKSSTPVLIQTVPSDFSWHVGVQMVLPSQMPGSAAHLIPLDFTFRNQLDRGKLAFAFGGATFDVPLGESFAAAKKLLFEHVKRQVLKSLENDHKSGTPIG